MKQVLQKLRIGKIDWVSWLLLLFVVYVFFQKEFSFQINVRDAEHLPRIHSKTPSEMGIEKEKTARLDLDPFAWKRDDTPRSAVQQLNTLPKGQIEEFARRFWPVCVAEQTKFGIPAQLILANALLQSKAGTYSPATSANNFFSLPCTMDWKGDTFEEDGICYRQYKTAWFSFRDHSLYLSQIGRLQGIREGDADLRSWIKAIHRSKAFSMENLEGQLLEVLQVYGLDQKTVD